MAKVLVTGGSGRLGGYVTPRLQEAGHDVTDFDAVPHAPVENQAAFVRGDLTSLEDCLRAVNFSEAEVIVHLGALPGPHELVKRPGWPRQQSAPEDLTMRVNTMGTYYLLEAARRLGTVRQVIFASSFYTLGLGNRISDRPFEVEYLPSTRRTRCGRRTPTGSPRSSARSSCRPTSGPTASPPSPSGSWGSSTPTSRTCTTRCRSRSRRRTTSAGRS